MLRRDRERDFVAGQEIAGGTLRGYAQADLLAGDEVTLAIAPEHLVLLPSE